ncbi:hypothetical protein [Parapedobacter koreensis]|uniref:Outer membrane protein beta-barrel domain-containing protein n=1 Tax=Parapedobacter koreensis TaxID=332977 RepID=A0A1H7M7B6_9SPHI|nr:hypothetical protein [Parapedobacter koreensis]SEL06989.1 hypothetical protein SAMN05421740_103391 [Parapedobacter koreensis]
MNLKNLVLIVLFFSRIWVANAQTASDPRKHNLSFGPMAGYNLDTKGLAYGGGLMYEYRPFQKFGFTAALMYERTRKDVSGDFWGDLNGVPIYGDVRVHQEYSLNVGARYYMGGFYLATALGVGYDDYYTNLSDGSTSDGGHAYGLYKSLGAGYQIPLKNRDVIEAEAGFFGTRDMKIGGTVRYKIRK